MSDPHNYSFNYPADEFWGWVPPDTGVEVPLQTQYWNISTWGGSRWSLPTLRGQDIEVPYSAGLQWRPKYPNSRTVTLAMWTAGISQVTGGPDTADQRLAFNNNFQQLRQLFWTRNAITGSVQGTLVRRWWLTQQGTNQVVKASAMAEVAGTVEPTMLGRTSASFSVDLLLADPYFYGPSRSQMVTTSGGVITALGEGVVGEGFPGALSAFTVALTASPVTVTNVTAGVSVTYSGPVTSPPVTLDVLNFQAADAAGTNQIAGVTHAGSRMWMCLLPGSNTITVSAGTAGFQWNDAYV